MWAPICQVGVWNGMFGKVDITLEKLDMWASAFGPNEKIPVTIGHRTDTAYQETGAPAVCWISGLMRVGDMLLGNWVDWTPEGLDALISHRYKNVSIESSRDGKRLTAVALLGARDPAVKYHDAEGDRFLPLDMGEGTLDDGAQVLLAQYLGTDDDPESKTGVTHRALRYRAQKNLQSACSVCGSSSNLRVHHIDGNEANNAAANCQTACGTCHRSWTKYQAGQDKGKGGRIPKGWSTPATAADEEPKSMPYSKPPKRITDLFTDTAGPALWLKAFNAAFDKIKDDVDDEEKEKKANKFAWSAIKTAGYAKDNEKWKKAGKAAEGNDMPKSKAKIALAQLSEGVLELLAELGVDVELLGEGDPPTNVLLEAAEIDFSKTPAFKALSEKYDDLEKKFAAQATEYAATALLSESKELCLAAKAKPAFIEPLAQLLALIPFEAEVVLAKADDPEKVIKAKARDFFKLVLVAKGNAKLDDPIALTKAPIKAEVEEIDVKDLMASRGPKDQAGRQKLADDAVRLHRKDPKVSLAEAQDIVLAEWDEKHPEVK